MQILAGKIVFISGASSGIGKACAEGFASAGAHLILCARNIDSVNEVANELKEELDKTEEAILKVASKPTLFRPPGGSYNDTTIKLTRNKGYLTILWSIDTKDWRSPPVGDIVNSVLKDIKPGSIILLHDGKYPSPTPEALGFIIDNLRSLGYEFTTVSELLGYYEAKP